MNRLSFGFFFSIVYWFLISTMIFCMTWSLSILLSIMIKCMSTLIHLKRSQSCMIRYWYIRLFIKMLQGCFCDWMLGNILSDFAFMKNIRFSRHKPYWLIIFIRTCIDILVHNLLFQRILNVRFRTYISFQSKHTRNMTLYCMKWFVNFLRCFFWTVRSNRSHKWVQFKRIGFFFFSHFIKNIR